MKKIQTKICVAKKRCRQCRKKVIQMKISTGCITVICLTPLEAHKLARRLDFLVEKAAMIRR